MNPRNFLALRFLVWITNDWIPRRATRRALRNAFLAVPLFFGVIAYSADPPPPKVGNDVRIRIGDYWNILTPFRGGGFGLFHDPEDRASAAVKSLIRNRTYTDGSIVAYHGDVGSPRYYTLDQIHGLASHLNPNERSPVLLLSCNGNVFDSSGETAASKFAKNFGRWTVGTGGKGKFYPRRFSQFDNPTIEQLSAKEFFLYNPEGELVASVDRYYVARMFGMNLRRVEADRVFDRILSKPLATTSFADSPKVLHDEVLDAEAYFRRFGKEPPKRERNGRQYKFSAEGAAALGKGSGGKPPGRPGLPRRMLTGGFRAFSKVDMHSLGMAILMAREELRQWNQTSTALKAPLWELIAEKDRQSREWAVFDLSGNPIVRKRKRGAKSEMEEYLELLKNEQRIRAEKRRRLDRK